MNLKLKKNVGFSLILFAFFFLFEPHYTLIDPLPDFIGYIILIIALTNLADVNYHIQDAKNGFKKGIVISIFRFVAIYILKNIFAEEQQSIGTLLFAFVLSFFELVVLIPAYKSVFDGLLSLGIMHDGTYVYYKNVRKKLKINNQTGEKTLYVRESKLNVSEKLYYLTVVLLFARALASCLPEFTSLSTNSSYEFVNLLRGFAFVIALPIGIVWLVSIIKYFASVKKDTAFISSLTHFYISEIKQRPNLFTVRDVTSILYFVLAAAVLSIDFFVDYINVVPNWIFFAVILSSIILVRKYSKIWVSLAITSSVGIVISSLTRYFAKCLYVDTEFSPLAIKKNLEIYLLYNKVVSFTVLDALWMLVAVVLIICLIWKIYKNYTDHALALAKNSLSEAKEMKGHFLWGAVAVIFTAALSAAGNIYCVMIQPFENDGVWYIYYAPVISIFVSIIFALTFVYFIMFVVNCIGYRYRTDM